MQLIYKGKTKDVYALENGNYLLQFKDDVTGENGIFDPGANTVGLIIPGISKYNLKMSVYFFELLEQNGIKTHYLKSDFKNGTMEVLPAQLFGHGLEIIVRKKAVGSFIRRYGEYIPKNSVLNNYTEITLKNDAEGDPLITKDGLIALNIMTTGEYEAVVAKAKTISDIIANELAKKQMTLFDIKFEFGKYNNEIILIDEISSGNMRVYRDKTALKPFEIVDSLFQD